jgi:hypothetical protein
MNVTRPRHHSVVRTTHSVNALALARASSLRSRPPLIL